MESKNKYSINQSFLNNNKKMKIHENEMQKNNIEFLILKEEKESRENNLNKNEIFVNDGDDDDDDDNFEYVEYLTDDENHEEINNIKIENVDNDDGDDDANEIIYTILPNDNNQDKNEFKINENIKIENHNVGNLNDDDDDDNTYDEHYLIEEIHVDDIENDINYYEIKNEKKNFETNEQEKNHDDGDNVEIIEEDKYEYQQDIENDKNDNNDDNDDNELDTYYCNTCNINFKLINEHIEKYHKNEIIDLNDDIIENNTNKQLINNEIDNESLFQLEIINSEGKKSIDKVETLKTNKNNESIECDICGAVYHSNISLSLHRRVHKKETNFKENPIKTKNREKTPDILYFCAYCNTQFQTMKSLKLHSKMHSTDTAANSFDRIIKSEKKIIGKSGHLTNENFWCKICEKSYDKIFQEIHEKSHENSIKIICKICNKIFDNDVDCKLHMKLHENHPERRGVTKAEMAGIKLPYACSYCGREFKKPHEKIKHERIHTGEKPYKCDICGKCFRVSYCLTLHIRTHTNSRPYVCATCNKRFKAAAVYTHHLASHSDERAYKCEYCPKKFKTAVSLAGHRKSHTKPFKCTECSRPFASLYAVKCHMETHKKSNAKLRHTCELCGANYVKIFALRDHIKEKHNNYIINDLNTKKSIKLIKEINHDDGTIIDDIIINTNDDDDDDNGNYNDNDGDDGQNNDESTAHIIEEPILDNKDEITVADVDNFHTEEIITDELWLKQEL